MRGEVDSIVITSMPTLESLARIKNGGNPDLTDLNRLTPLLALEQPILVHADGTHVRFSDDTFFAVMINNPDMHMKKFLL